MNEKVAALLAELKTGLQALHGENLRGVYLFGSFARGEVDAESDVDVLIVLKRIENYGREVRRAGQLGADLSLKYGVSVSKVFVSERDWQERETPFLLNVREEAIAL